MNAAPKTCKQWLSEPWDGDSPFDDDLIPEAPTPTRAQVIAALISLNGGHAVVSQWGIQQIGGGLYGRVGLSQDEAICLIQHTAYMDGLIDGSGEDSKAISEIIIAELNRVIAIWQRASGIEGDSTASKEG